MLLKFSLLQIFLGKGWIKQMLFSTALFPSMICGTAFLINFVAIYYRASRAIPFTSMVSYMFTVLDFFINRGQQCVCRNKT